MCTTLSAERLMDEARSHSGLDDFGDPWFREPLEVLVGAINAEAGLVSAETQPVQRIRQALADRLRLVALLKRQPEILDEEVRVAGAILGLPRTGSTMLQRLLGASPQLTSGYWWEVAFPLPLDNEAPGDPGPRQVMAMTAVAAFYREWPDFDSIHPLDALAHDEEVLLLDRTFLSSTYDSIMQIPSYGLWMAAQDHRQAYEELKVWLQILQSQSPARRGRSWILKTPHHLMGGLKALLTVFPEAKAIMTHRRIEDVIPSYCSMCAAIGGSYAAHYDLAAEGPYWTRRFSDALHTLIAIREGPMRDRFIDVRYDELTADPLATARSVFARLGLAFTESDARTMTAWLAANRREKRPQHRYAPRTFGLREDSMAADFAFYRNTFEL